MKAIVLAGGHATRLWPITRNRAKPLIPLNGRPLIDYIVQELEDLDKVDSIYISTNKKFAPDFQAYLNEHDYDKAEIVVENQASEENKPGTIGAVIKLLQQKNADEDYLIIGGDNYYSFQLSDFIDFAAGRPAIACFDVKSDEQATSFGIVEADHDGKIIDFVEKPENPPSTLASTACYFFPQDTIHLFHDYNRHFAQTDIPKDQYLDEPGRLIEWAHKQQDMYAYSFTGNWFDVGTREGYLLAQRKLHPGNRLDGEVTDCELGENVWVMEGAHVEGTELHECIIFPDVEIREASLKGTIIDQHASLSNVSLKDSLVGEHSQLHQ
jgi:glucose-1-phosphate thymidylyltransferase